MTTSLSDFLGFRFRSATDRPGQPILDWQTKIGPGLLGILQPIASHLVVTTDKDPKSGARDVNFSVLINTIPNDLNRFTLKIGTNVLDPTQYFVRMSLHHRTRKVPFFQSWGGFPPKVVTDFEELETMCEFFVLRADLLLKERSIDGCKDNLVALIEELANF